MRQYRLLSLLFALILLATAVRTAWAPDRQYYWEFVDADATALENSDIRVVETQSFVFTSGGFHFGYRGNPRIAWKRSPT